MQTRTIPSSAADARRPFRLIVTCLALGLACHSSQAQYQDENMDIAGSVREGSGRTVRIPSAPAALGVASDDVIQRMANAFRRKDTATLGSLLPQAMGHPLEPWAAYWELSARLQTAQPYEVDAFLQRYAGSYQEDRLRNDWLLQLGKNRDFQAFNRYYPAFRMRDDRNVRCYAQVSGAERAASAVEMLRENWYPQRNDEEACNFAAGQLYASGTVKAEDIWHRARLATENNRQAAARSAVAIVDPAAASQLSALFANPAAFLAMLDSSSRSGGELAVLALLRVANSTPQRAAQLMHEGWSSRLNARQRNTVWGEIGKQAVLDLDSQSMNYYSQVRDLHDLLDDDLEWMARSALRTGYWPQVRQAIDAMTPAMREQPVWVYWKARALQGGLHGRGADRQSEQLYRSIAGNQGFYEMLATEALGERITRPRDARPGSAELAQARANPSLQRAQYARNMGLASEATREWNYATNLHTPGGMNDRDLLAAAELACQQQWWDRCINTSDRTKGVINMEQRFPMPFREVVVRRSRNIGLDPAYVYGLVRQESRFATNARSHVGASGLMQVMPATARWTANKLGISYAPSMINNLETNVQLGTGYLKLVLDDFQGSYPMATAAYNAGPSRPRSWRNGPVMEGAAWAESIPFGETRDYIKKVLANSTNYAILLTGQPQSLRERLGQVGPLLPGVSDLSRELPSGTVRVIESEDGGA